MDKKLWGLALIAFSLILTKPPTNNFPAFLAKDLCFRVQENILAATCKTLVLVQKNNIETLIDMNTEVNNYLVFDHYTTKIPGFQFKTIGIARTYRIYNIKSTI